ncbi:Murein DD-endopeptidase MepM [compost metagenome]
MEPRKTRNHSDIVDKRSGRVGMGVIGVLVVVAVLCLLLIEQQVQAPQPPVEAVKPKREMIDFHMADLNRGWVQYKDGVMTTEDGGISWIEAAADISLTRTEDPELHWLNAIAHNPLSVTLQNQSYAVKQSQFLTDNIGWVLLPHEAELKTSLWITYDGGTTWLDKVTPEVTKVMQAELEQLGRIQKEAVYYKTPEAAQQTFQSAWTLLPNKAFPGDVVLIRHRDPGSVSWEGKEYPLQSFGHGYFTYLPISMNVKPGSYPIGDQALTIQAKKFDTQYLKVTQQMESMKQDTARIQADQKKIDLARSTSEPEFLFTGPFLEPIKGILTTPFGFTRYVNGKYDSSHRALDLAAKEGTPIKATNDGVVALADSLYLTGNTIYIDHGMNLFSQYAHLSELKVKTGDRVKQGDIIGLVGTTGFSTGPHLHFTFWAHNVPVNPNLFFGTTPFGW